MVKPSQVLPAGGKEDKGLRRRKAIRASAGLCQSPPDTHVYPPFVAPLLWGFFLAELPGGHHTYSGAGETPFPPASQRDYESVEC